MADKLSILAHDYFDIVDIIDRRQPSSRGEKTTTLTIDASVTQDELKAVLGSYKEEKKDAESVKFNLTGTESAVLEIDYDEFDFSKTRLAQRQPKEARIEFKAAGGAISVRMPASDKAREVVANLQDKLSRLKKQEIDTIQIEVGTLTPELRTKFFTTLMSKLPGYTYRTVTNVRVSPSERLDEDDELSLEDEAPEEIKEEILSYVRSVAMSGENLAVSPEYKQLLESGYFVTAITWRAEHRASPYHLVRFEAGFENGATGTGFRYSVRYAPRTKDGSYATTFRSFDSIEREQHLQALEVFARQTLDDLQELNDTDEGTASGKVNRP
ncbi:hypothetical protein Q7W82_14085 [Xanthomonas indica]|uniref:Uncharacterized protein n=1 Tax=Xanthomonas indica TaxID=2912242 RepID=A0AAU8I1Y7_9XANT